MELTDKRPVRMTGRIVQALAPGWWIIEDARRRKHRVAGSGRYRRGDKVTVIEGQIVASGRGGGNGKLKIYEV